MVTSYSLFVDSQAGLLFEGGGLIRGARGGLTSLAGSLLLTFPVRPGAKSRWVFIRVGGGGGAKSRHYRIILFYE